MTAQDAIDAGLTPRQLEHLIRNKTPEWEIAAAYSMGITELVRLMRRWGLDHLGGRGKTNVMIVKECGR
jgi:hypothetical protein